MQLGARMVLVAIVALVLQAGPAAAQFDELALGAKAGTLGWGGELTTDLLPGLNLRGSLQWLNLNFTSQFADIDYDVDLKFFNPMVMLDWYPFGGPFRISGGALFNGSDISLEATSNEPIDIGGTLYTPSDYGTLRGTADFRPVAPYVGIGFGNAVSPNQRWGLTVDLGVAFIGSPDVALSATGPIASDPTFQAQLAQQERDVEHDLHRYQYYPVLALSLFFRF
jgi:hypothetical protein